MVRDIRPGSSSSFPSNLVCCKGKVYFSASNGTNGSELWCTNGTSAGTVMVKDIYPGSGSSTPSGITCIGDKLYFSAFVSGTGATGREPWTSDGTSAGTTLLRDIRTGSLSSSPFNFVKCGKLVYFRASNGTNGTELWRTAGTTATTAMVKDIRPGSSSSFPSNLVCCNDKLFFTANNGTNGTELWTSNGTAAGTVMVKDIYTGTGSSSPSYLKCAGKGVYFSAFVSSSISGNGRELWFSDGTAAGTKEVCDIYPGGSSSSPSFMTLLRRAS